MRPDRRAHIRAHIVGFDGRGSAGVDNPDWEKSMQHAVRKYLKALEAGDVEKAGALFVPQ